MNKGYIALPWFLFGAVLVVFLIYVSTQSQDGEIIVTSSAGDEISKQELYEEMLSLNGEEIVNLLIFERLVQLEADEKKVSVTEQEIDDEFNVMKGPGTSDEEFSMMLAQQGMSEVDLLDQIEIQLTLRKLFEKDLQIAEDELKDFYEENKEMYIEGESIRASHILVDSLEEAENVLGKLKQGEDFALLAETHSLDGSKDQGGDLGFFGRGEMTPPFEDAAFSLDIGEQSGIVESQFGFHIIELTDRKEETTYAFEEIKDEIRNNLLDMEISNILPGWVEQLKETYNFEIKTGF